MVFIESCDNCKYRNKNITRSGGTGNLLKDNKIVHVPVFRHKCEKNDYTVMNYLSNGKIYDGEWGCCSDYKEKDKIEQLSLFDEREE